MSSIPTPPPPPPYRAASSQPRERLLSNQNAALNMQQPTTALPATTGVVLPQQTTTNAYSVQAPTTNAYPVQAPTTNAYPAQATTTNVYPAQDTWITGGVSQVKRTIDQQRQESQGHEKKALEHAYQEEIHHNAAKQHWDNTKNSDLSAGQRVGSAVDSVVHKVREISEGLHARREQKKAFHHHQAR